MKTIKLGAFKCLAWCYYSSHTVSATPNYICRNIWEFPVIGGSLASMDMHSKSHMHSSIYSGDTLSCVYNYCIPKIYHFWFEAIIILSPLYTDSLQNVTCLMAELTILSVLYMNKTTSGTTKLIQVRVVTKKGVAK